MPKLIRVTTVPMALKFLLPGQMRFMSSHGFEVVMVSADGPERAEVMEQEQCPHIIVPMTRSITPLHDLRALLRLYRLFRQQQPDIVHSHTPKAGLLSMLAARMAGVKVRIHTVAGLRFMTSTGITRRVLRGMEKMTAAAATHVWPNSGSLLGYIRLHRLAPERKLEVIGMGSSNGIDLSRFDRELISPAGIAGAADTIGFDNSCFYLLAVGRLVKDKGISELVTAFSNLYISRPLVRLVLVGSMEEDLDPLDPHTLLTLRTHPGIIMTGWRNDIENFMAIASVLVHPSYREGFPNVLLQAGALGLPVACSRIEGNTDIVTDGETGLLFEAKDAKDLERVLEKVIAGPDEQKQFASALFTKVTRYYERKHVHQSIKNRYLAILDEGRNQ